MLFSYNGRDRDGNLIKGTIEASTADAVAKLLLQQHIVPVSIKSASSGFNWSGLWRTDIFGQAPKRDELASFCRQMYTLYKAGVPLSKAISRVAQTTRHPGLASALNEIARDIEQGRALASSLEKHQDVFPGLFASLLRVGEESGRLQEAFLQLSEYLELEDKTIKQLKSVLRYPIIVISAISIAFIVLTIFVIPAFATFFASFNTKLPWATVLLLNLSAFMRAAWPFLLLALIGGAIALKYAIKTPKGRYRWHQMQLKLPVVGSLLQKVLYARFGRAFAMVARTGLSLHRGLELVAKALGNDVLAKKLTLMQDDLARGETLSKAAQKSQAFPMLVLQMFSVGEESGSLDDVLDQLADYYEREVEYGLKRLKDALEPLLLILVAAMVLVLALGVFMPMWGMTQFARQ